MPFDLEAAIRRLEYLAQTHPRAYRRRVALWAALGYGALGLFPASLLLLMGASFYLARSNSWCLLAAAFLLAALGLSLSAFLVRLAPPVGIPLRRADAPALFARIKTLATALKVRPVEKLLLTPDGGAAIAELPLPWGGTRSYLLLGLPLLESLTLPQLDAVLAHELAHLGANDGQFARGATRIASIWTRLMQQIAHGGGAGRTLTRFARWYFPRLSAHTFAVRRDNERAADRRAAEIATPADLADALCAVELRLRFLESAFQSALHERARTVPSPPEKVFRAYVQTLHAPFDDADVEVCLRAARGEPSRFDDPHPRLCERLEALDQPLRVPPSPELSAAQELLAPCRERFLDVLDALWRKQLTPEWRRTFLETRARKRERAALDEKINANEFLTSEERLRHALLTEFFEGGERALPLLQKLRSDPETGARATMAIGRLRLAAGDPSGVALIEGALPRLPGFADDALHLLHDYHRAQGNAAAAREALRRLSPASKAPPSGQTQLTRLCYNRSFSA